MSNPFNDHNGQCTPVKPCSHCVGMQYLRDRLGDKGVATLLSIFRGEESVSRQPLLTEVNEIVQKFRSEGASDTSVTQLETWMRKKKVTSWEALDFNVTGRGNIYPLSEKAQDELKRVIESHRDGAKE